MMKKDEMFDCTGKTLLSLNFNTKDFILSKTQHQTQFSEHWERTQFIHIHSYSYSLIGFL